MLPNFLLTETVADNAGAGPALEIPAGSANLMITLGITRIVEQESLDLWITGSADGQEWTAKPLLRFPQKFYCGTYSMVLNLNDHPGVRYLRAEYKMARWGRGDRTPLFGFFVFAEAVQVGNRMARAVA